MPFCHLIHDFIPNTEVDTSKIYKVSSRPAVIKYKFGIQVTKGIKNENELDKKNRNQLWKEGIKTEIKQLTSYQTIILSEIHNTRFRGGYSNRS
jgi:hypothetical protein